VIRATATDAELLARTRREAQAFAVFYDRYEQAVLGFFMNRTHDPELAADLTAEVFAAALRAARRFRAQEETAAPWLFTIAHNVLRSSLRRGRVEARARQRLGIREPVVHAAEDLERIEALADDSGWVVELVDRLPPDQREAVRARVVDERSYEDIAQALSTSQLVIRKRVSRGLAALRLEMEDSHDLPA
jgi:RNA polymerase sigma factor (sigma-70 family)